MNRTRQLLFINFPLSVLFVLCCSPFLRAQSEADDSVWLNSDWYYSTGDSSFIDLSGFLPSFLKNEIHLKRYLRDERFYILRKQYDDTLAVDAIFDHAMLLAEGNVKEALLLSLFAVMDHRQLGFKIPVVGSLYIPLTYENDSLFRLWRMHLPKKVLNDNLRSSDKDKLQHFFGSAFLAYELNSNTIVRWIGDLLELGEDRFVLGGRNDVRDQLANERGREFGLRLHHEDGLLPSDVLWNRSN